jgi:hypothetical protein
MAMVATLAVTVDGNAVASSSVVRTPAPAASSAAATSADHPFSLGADTVRPHQAGRAAPVRKWKVRTLYYYDALPAKWDWSLQTAVGKWNASGAHILLARVAKAGNAQVRIGYGNIGSAAGLATVGATTNAFVRLSSRFSSMDALNARNRVAIMNVLAHELGHVLGFQHTAARCSLMSPVLDIDACNVVPASIPGYYKCHTLDTPLVQRFVRLYGGRARYPSAAWCLIDPLPQALTGVTFTGGTSSPVAVHWNRPTSVPAGSTLVVKRWPSSTCGTAPSWAETSRPSMSLGVWLDQPTDDAEVDCFQVQLVNRYGAGPAPQKRVLARWVPSVDAPVIGVPSYDFDAEQFTFTASVPAGTTLRARWDTAHPATCVTSPSGGTDGDFVQVIDGHGSLVIPGALPQCVSFFATDSETGRSSSPVSVTFTQPVSPNPDAPVVGTPTYDFDAEQFTFSVTVPDGATLRARWDTAHPSTCVTSPTGGTNGAFVPVDGGQGSLVIPTALPQCVSFFASDPETNLFSDPVFVTFTEPNWPNPDAPVVGTPTYDRVGAQFTVPVTVPDGAQLVARWNSTSPGTCVTSATAGSSQNVAFADGVATIAESGTFPRCVSFFANDGQHSRYSVATSVTLAVPTPASPTIGTATWDAAASKFHASASIPAGTHLVYNMTNTASVCPATTAAGGQTLAVSNGVTDFQTLYPNQCVSFFAVDNRSGVTSASTQVTVDAPLPTETPTIGPISVMDRLYPWFEAQPTGVAAGDKLGYQVFPGACPQTPPAVTQWRTQRQSDGYFGTASDPHADWAMFPSAAADTNCLVYTSVDWFYWTGSRPSGWLTERHGPVLMKEFVDEGPVPPTVGTPVWNSTSGRFQIPVSHVQGLHVIYDPSDPTTCPPPGTSGTQAVSTSDLGGGVVMLTPPASHVCLTFYNDAGQGPVPVSFGTPVDLTVPQG